MKFRNLGSSDSENSGILDVPNSIFRFFNLFRIFRIPKFKIHSGSIYIKYITKSIYIKVVAVCRFCRCRCFCEKNDKKRLIHYYLLFIELLNKFTTMADPTDWWYYFKKTEQGNVASCMQIDIWTKVPP
jgi:hypothetical protein